LSGFFAVAMRLSFDRGTLLVDPEPGEPAPGWLPGVLWDPRVERYRAPAYRYAELRAALLRAGVALADHVLAMPLRDADASRADGALRPYQAAALMAWRAAGARGIVVLPTGSGKTRIACAAIGASRSALVLVPTRALLHQWRAELGRATSRPVGCFGDGRHDLAALCIATFESAYRYMARLGSRFELLVVDEVHHFGGSIRDEALEMCAAPWRMGLTATPAKGPAEARLEDLVGPAVFQLGLGDLAGVWLADLDVVVLRLRLTAEERLRHEADVLRFRSVYAAFRRSMPGGAWTDFVAAAQRSADGQAALRCWRRARHGLALTSAKRQAVSDLLSRHRGQRVLVFTQDNESAYAIARAELVMPITCDIERAERERALAAFRDGRLSTLVSSRVLNEGLDVPDAEVAIIVGAALGEREHVQRVGRLLRPRPGKRAIVYELVTTGTAELRRARGHRAALAGRRGEDLACSL